MRLAVVGEGDFLLVEAAGGRTGLVLSASVYDATTEALVAGPLVASEFAAGVYRTDAVYTWPDEKQYLVVWSGDPAGPIAEVVQALIPGSVFWKGLISGISLGGKVPAAGKLSGSVSKLSLGGKVPTALRLRGVVAT